MNNEVLDPKFRVTRKQIIGILKSFPNSLECSLTFFYVYILICFGKNEAENISKSGFLINNFLEENVYSSVFAF